MLLRPWLPSSQKTFCYHTLAGSRSRLSSQPFILSKTQCLLPRVVLFSFLGQAWEEEGTHGFWCIVSNMAATCVHREPCISSFITRIWMSSGGSLNLTHELVNKLGDLSVKTKVKTKLPIQRSIYKLWWPTYLLSILNLERARGQWLVWCSWGHTETTARLTEFPRGYKVHTPLLCSVGFTLTHICLLLFLRCYWWPQEHRLWFSKLSRNKHSWCLEPYFRMKREMHRVLENTLPFSPWAELWASACFLLSVASYAPLSSVIFYLLHAVTLPHIWWPAAVFPQCTYCSVSGTVQSVDL